MTLAPFFLRCVVAFTCRDAKAGDVPLKPGTLQDADLVPFVLRYPLREGLPKELVGPGHAVKPHGRDLLVDSQGDGRLNLTVSKTSQVVVIRKDSLDVSLLLYRRGDAWIASPASIVHGVIGKREITFLDANCDGDCCSSNDWVRFDDGAFQRCSNERALASDNLLVDYTIHSTSGASGKNPVMSWQPQAKPAWANDLQWSGLLATNALRNQQGLAPFALDKAVSHACQLHAEYLYLNNYDYSRPWDGVGSHEELPDHPGFTEEGRDASHNQSTSGSSDPVQTARVLFDSMIHRTSMIGKDGFGIGTVDKSHNASSNGYTVMGGRMPVVDHFEDVVVIPGPGSRRIPRTADAERPAPEKYPGFYSKARGYPISVSFGALPVADFAMDLFEGERRLQLPGVLFSPANPIHSTRPTNGSSAFFVPNDPLKSNEVYEVRFRCTLRGEAQELVWRFWTEK